MPAEWAQNLQPELVPVTRARPGAGDAGRDDRDHPRRRSCGRSSTSAGPTLVHRLEYADSLSEAADAGAAWAVLPDDVECEDGWRLEVHSAPWVVYRQVPGASCR